MRPVKPRSVDCSPPIDHVSEAGSPSIKVALERDHTKFTSSYLTLLILYLLG